MSDSNLPRHVAIIMDGNGRWAKKRFFPRTQGHKAAIKSVRAAIEFAAENKIQMLTLFAFGRENWLRPQEEVDTLMQLFTQVLVDELPLMEKHHICLSVIGDRRRLAPQVLENIHIAESTTIGNRNLALNIAIDYSGQWELADVCRRLAFDVKEGRLSPESIDELMLEASLIKPSNQPIDLLIRTSGEQRISNFMIWQLSYAELYFCQKYWPDFTKVDFKKALDDYQKRQRRFGKTAEQLTSAPSSQRN
ncbi:MAG: polyprenyl diphosphate synthase [Francisellaceae bacterium]